MASSITWLNHSPRAVASPNARRNRGSRAPRSSSVSFTSNAITRRMSAVGKPEPRERRRDLVENRRIIDRGRHAILDPVRDLFDGAAQDLAGARLGQPLDDGGGLEARHRANPLADHLDDLSDHGVGSPSYACLQYDESQGDLSLELVRYPHHGAFGPLGMSGQDLH